MGGYSPKKTLDEANQFYFVCPIFHAETSMASCMKLREMVWRGEAPQQRQGCQVCMKAGKCPINNIIWDMVRNPNSDPYGSDTKKVGQLSDKHLDQIARVIVPERFMDRFDLSEKEVLMIRKANAAAGSGVMKRARRDTTSHVEEHIETPESVDLTAAKTGDMSAAINAVLKENNNGQS